MGKVSNFVLNTTTPLTPNTLIEICTPTVSSTLIDRITLNTPLFGLIFYYSQWIFLLSVLLGFIISLFKSPISQDTIINEIEASEIEAEEQGLLDGSSR